METPSLAKNRKVLKYSCKKCSQTFCYFKNLTNHEAKHGIDKDAEKENFVNGCNALNQETDLNSKPTHMYKEKKNMCRL